ncbi:MAG: purine-nucleoside phosphorylase [Tissierellia bacterium]|nr:purine-nucleoside phosphorylase [Tissierellia bacterium]
MTNKVMESVAYLRSRGIEAPHLGLVLGSGLGDFAQELEGAMEIPYADIPGFPVSTVEGHSGSLIYGSLGEKKLLCMKGRIHFYEGYPMDQVVHPIKVLCDMGIEGLILTNAAGGVGDGFQPGDLMLITDHINFSGINPLLGKNDEKGPRFPDMTHTYDVAFMDHARAAARELSLKLQEGVYMYLTGPSYETPAEVRMAKILGAHAVGMSTVPEAIVAHHRSVPILGISCITNLAAGISDQPLNHQEVMETSARVKEDFTQLLKRTITQL